MEKRLAYIRMMRPANVVTSVADVLAGIAISGYFLSPVMSMAYIDPVLLLCLSTIGLYSGGIIFNDVFDFELDKLERPERALPSGIVSIREATIFGAICFAVGIIAAAFVNTTSLSMALLVMIAALTYDKWGKHLSLIGPVNMGLCRGLNLLLGVTIISTVPEGWWLIIAVIPIIYIASITMISRGEVHGGSKKMLYFAALLYILVVTFILFIAHNKGHFLLTLVFVVPFYWMIFTPLFKAMEDPVGKNIGKAVKAGVIALILLNAAWASAFGIWYIALVIALLLPLSIWLSKTFAVT
ncbi:UbiA-like protein EboC [Pedobacter sp. BAL39]|uniref:UbiA-like protein EboC n=1 Tax=Pedobacter sp. BAL39 TaxID=391596 RepID=UPI0018DC73E8|nr:UbiA-like protein EboC [Pedobacter sp. BAL39]